MNIYRLTEIAYGQRHDAYLKYGDDRGLILFLNYSAFQKIRTELCEGAIMDAFPYAQYLHKAHEFLFMNVRVSWSPLVEQPDGYAYGRETLT